MKKMILIIGLACVFSAHNLYAEESLQQSAPEVIYSQAELEQLLAPIALYPDSLLTHILIASTYPIEVIEAERWLAQNPNLSADEVVKRSEGKLWDPSIMALLPFPQIINKLSTELTWTQKLGDAFLANQEGVLASVQSLRQKADAAGNLNDIPNVKVVREVETIIIKPAVPEVIYVPYYDTTVVYGHWHWNHYPPVYWAHHNHYAHHHGHYYWGAPVHLSVGIFFGNVHWNSHHVVVRSHHNSHYYGHHYRHYKRHYSTHKKHYSSGKKHYASNSKKVHRQGYKNQWKHNPVHRKGVAYRNDRLAKTYKSNRPSVQKTRYVRSQERNYNASNKAVKYSKNSTMNAKHKQAKVVSNKTRHQAITDKVRANNQNWAAQKQTKQRKATAASVNQRSRDFPANQTQRAVQGSNKSQAYNNKTNRVNNNKSSAKANTQRERSTYKASTNSTYKANTTKSYKSNTSKSYNRASSNSKNNSSYRKSSSNRSSGSKSTNSRQSQRKH